MRIITINSMQCRPEADGLTNVVESIDWTVTDIVTIDASTHTVTGGGSTQVSSPNPEEFTPYDQLTEPVVATWVAANTDLDALVAKLVEQLARQLNPPTVTLDTPWAAE